MASHDPVYAACLEASLRARGMDAVPAEPRRMTTGDGLDLDSVDVLLLETWGLGDSEWALVERVRDRSPMTEIVAISSDPEVEGAVQALRSGVFAVLAYPVSDDQLVEAIAAACARKRRGEQRMKALEDRRTT